MFIFLIISVITAVVFFNLCVKIAIKIKNNEDVGSDKIFASTMLIIGLSTFIMLMVP
ncbi:hypothetical protein ACERII_05555 [Evansella sp. AB-rgal1]|uniref:hypothetical protein n=1 Tax=Evansella sp. AB-rgal1 TaxID=3242696 RepID=UPI00359E702E